MKKPLVLLLAIFIFALFLRLFQLGEIPSGFYNDESLVGYEAYSLLKTGKDQYGKLLPLIFRAFGDYRPGLFIYTVIPSVILFGLNEFAVRLPAGLFSSFTALFVYLVSLELFRNQKAALIGAFIFSVSPWSLQFARMAHETNLATLLTIMSIWLLLKALKNNNWLYTISFSFAAFSVYAYYTTRLFVPLFFAFCFFYFRKKFLLKPKSFIKYLILPFIIMLPFLLTLNNPEAGWSRVSKVGIWNDPGIISHIERGAYEDNLFETRNSSRIFHNKALDGGLQFANALSSHFAPDFLLFSGDPVKIYKTVGTGILLWLEPIFICVAVLYLRDRRYDLVLFLCAWFVIGLLPDALTRYYPAAARIHLVLPLVSILSGLGLAIILKNKYRYLFGIFISIILAFNSLYFMHAHFIHTPVQYALEWHYGLDQVAEYVRSTEQDYDTVWFSENLWGWINMAFYLQYPPEKMQQEIVLSSPDEFGLSWSKHFGKYTFDHFPGGFIHEGNVLFVGAQTDFPSNVVPKFEVKYPDGKIAFWAVDMAEVQRAIAPQ